MPKVRIGFKVEVLQALLDRNITIDRAGLFYKNNELMKLSIFKAKKDKRYEYHYFNFNKKSIMARRVVWYYFNNTDIPSDMRLMTKNNNSLDDSIDNLILVSSQMAIKNAHLHCKTMPTEKRSNSSLTNKQVANLRADFRETNFNLQEKSHEYGISQNTLQEALTGKTYRDVPNPISKSEFSKIKLLVKQVVPEIKQIVKRKPRVYNGKITSSKFTTSQVTDLREEFRLTGYLLKNKAKELNVAVDTLSEALTGKTYRDVPNPITNDERVLHINRLNESKKINKPKLIKEKPEPKSKIITVPKTKEFPLVKPRKAKLLVQKSPIPKVAESHPTLRGANYALTKFLNSANISEWINIGGNYFFLVKGTRIYNNEHVKCISVLECEHKHSNPELFILLFKSLHRQSAYDYLYVRNIPEFALEEVGKLSNWYHYLDEKGAYIKHLLHT